MYNIVTAFTCVGLAISTPPLGAAVPVAGLRFCVWCAAVWCGPVGRR